MTNEDVRNRSGNEKERGPTHLHFDMPYCHWSRYGNYEEAFTFATFDELMLHIAESKIRDESD